MDAYLGEIRLFAGTFAPKGWMDCAGQLVRIRDFVPLFSVIGVQYGGDGKNTFGLPDLRGSVAIGQGQGPGLSPRFCGERGGAASVALTAQEMPAHNHIAMGVSAIGSANSPSESVWSQYGVGGRPPTPVNLYNSSGDVQMGPDALQTTGQGVAHNNMQPFLALRYIICIDGEFPPRS